MMLTHITNLLVHAILTLFKDSLTLIGLLFVMFIKIGNCHYINNNDTISKHFSKNSLEKELTKVTTEAQEKSGFLTTYFVELFKNHKLIKIFQKERL